MKLPLVPRLSTLSDLAAWANVLASSIAQAWKVNHAADGTHTFDFQPISYSAANFFGSGTMTWGVAGADVQTYHYARVGNLVILQWAIATSDCSGGSTELRLALPPRLVCRSVRAGGAHWYQDAGGTPAMGRAVLVQGEPFLRIQKSDVTNWTATTADDTRTEGTIWYQVTP